MLNSIVYLWFMLMLCCQLQKSYIQARSSEQLKFKTNCQNTNKQAEITANYPFGVIKLNMTCRASNNYLSLTPLLRKRNELSSPKSNGADIEITKHFKFHTLG